MKTPGGENWGVEAIKAPGAWAYLDKLSKVKVGLIDTPPSRSHEDLVITKTISSFSGKNAITSEKSYEEAFSPDDHGTHVAGTMAATYNNDKGVSGVMADKAELYYAQSYTVESNNEVSVHSTSEHIMSISMMAKEDVKVINISMGFGDAVMIYAASRGNTKAQELIKKVAKPMEKALKRLIESGKEFIIVTSAGNDNSYKHGKPLCEFFPDSEATFGYRGYNDRNLIEILKGSLGFHGEYGDVEAKWGSQYNVIEDEAVKSRIVVVGAVGIDDEKSKSGDTRYKLGDFSNVGTRVDILAPGVDIYSTAVDGYMKKSGTSMASPHVAGVAGLVFAANPNLKGSDVKKILLASTNGRYFYYNGYSGICDAEKAVTNALKTKEKSVNSVVKPDAAGGLDLCFVVDTTSSMGDDIDDAKANMNDILDKLTQKSEDYRVALIDYRDFPERAGIYDYPSKVQLAFTGDKSEITDAINGLDLGSGGDVRETVYSALMDAINLDWRTDATKAIIVLGDAPPLDPEPNTGYTLDSVLSALKGADVEIDMDNSDTRVLDSADDSFIKVFSVGTSASEQASEFFSDISESTGGSYTDVENATEVADAIIETIDKIELAPRNNVKASFGEGYSGETVEMYKNGEFYFDFVLDESGYKEIGSMEIGDYRWKIQRLQVEGTLNVADEKTSYFNFDKKPWYQLAIKLWQRDRIPMIVGGTAGIIFIAGIIIISRKIKTSLRKRKIEKQNSFICPICKTKHDEKIVFCGNCGHKMTDK